MPAATATSPWYKHLWPWIIIGVLATSVTLSLTMVTIAVNNPDNLVNDNYYEAGKGINRSLDRELLAQTLNLKASVHLDELTGEVDVRLSGNSQPKTLELNLISPTQPQKDRKIILTLSANEAGRYVGQLNDKVEGRRFVELLGSQDEHTWRLFEEEQVGHDTTLQLGDEALQGAEHLEK
ncbi:FixH family protein [Pseudomonas alkylphenolica]|uniref:FixH family protein n=1 Tax=Pseudomonas alkylphenolica TaxID=237609 RepID=UPI0018D77480|nr:FixH family protein [Pseudomonas alkylphenolica]MBH3428614.1 FixH family protein [Pseudomonas alkylphenolica]